VVPIGRPLSNVQVYVLDRRLQPMPDGLAGELFIGGSGLARGYLGQPGLTAERFLPHPFSEGPGERLYRTGDLARRGPRGELEFLGRADGQVKIRGFRIELGEIEAALACHPEIAAAAVVARDGGAGEYQLVAYYQVIATKSPVPRELRDFLQRSLPDPMVPTVFVELPALPSSPSGKVDRNALPEPGRGAHLPAEFIAPRTAVEQALARIWESLLGIERVGVNDNFFDLGGHSLQSMRMVSHVRDILGLELRVRSIFEHPTLGGLAKVATSEMVQQLGEDLVAELLAPGPDPSSVGGESA
jgi:acyl carrier protein